MKKTKKISSIDVGSFVWENEPEKSDQLPPPDYKIIPLTDDNAIYFKNSQYMRDMVANPKIINKRSHFRK